jgi:hypothetical protein
LIDRVSIAAKWESVRIATYCAVFEDDRQFVRVDGVRLRGGRLEKILREKRDKRYR